LCEKRKRRPSGTHAMRKESSMKLKDLMTPQVERIHKDTNLQEAAQKMKTLDVGMLPVYEGDRLIGMITDRDIAIRAVAEGRNPMDVPAHEVMTPEVVYCFEDQTIQDAAKVMKENQIRRLIVLNRDKR